MKMADTMEDSIAWSKVDETSVAIEKLRLLCHTRAELTKEGYVAEPLSVRQIEAKMRCLKCSARVKKRPGPKCFPAPVTENKIMNPGSGQKKTDNSNKRMNKGEHVDAAPKGPPPPRCVYHPGRVKDKRFLCCGKHVSQPGCIEYQEHILPLHPDNRLLEYWQYHPTPDFDAEDSVHRSPGRRPGGKQLWQDKRIVKARRRVSAIALDCEMGISTTGESELIRLTAVEFFNGDVLIDRLVYPNEPMQHWNTRYSGITGADMHDAKRRGACIFGRDMARELLWRHIRPETIIIVHGGQNDLSALRWLHSRVVDSLILESYMGVKTAGGRSLQNLCKLKLGIAVQQKGARVGHDSLEDAMACRELVIDWMRRIPED
ncbi:ribonuclease H-like domain-containing protein [Exophiala viscosa]|uniref:Ribonuclease H-like domain-containing protein n=1 Tax=Exophiala viscosa TaxID=2486360 RepID=A0AAN6E511_9EURO|nr:ribonuclease H-like domain-containing protein [Exophiala viscosa]